MNKPAVMVIMTLIFGAGLSAAAWIEIGAAGDLPATAQRTAGAGPLTAINGRLSGLAEVDMYLIDIVDPPGFSAATTGALGLVPDPKLFLFTQPGRGVYMNDDAGGSQSLLPAAHALGPDTAGLYLLAIGRFDNTPLGALGPIFDTGAADGVNGPAGTGTVLDWNRDVTGRIDFDDEYFIQLTGANFANVPDPATLFLVSGGLAAMIAMRRKVTRPVTTIDCRLASSEVSVWHGL